MRRYKISSEEQSLFSDASHLELKNYLIRTVKSCHSQKTFFPRKKETLMKHIQAGVTYLVSQTIFEEMATNTYAHYARQLCGSR